MYVRFLYMLSPKALERFRVLPPKRNRRGSGAVARARGGWLSNCNGPPPPKWGLGPSAVLGEEPGIGLGGAWGWGGDGSGAHMYRLAYSAIYSKRTGSICKYYHVLTNTDFVGKDISDVKHKTKIACGKPVRS